MATKDMGKKEEAEWNTRLNKIARLRQEGGRVV